MIDPTRILLWRKTATTTPGIFGTLVVPERRMDGKYVNRILKTLELPDLDNTPRKSCIPVGDYPLRKRTAGRFYKRYSAKFGHQFVVEICDVPGRSHVLLHIGNWIKDSYGCVLIGQRCRGEAGCDKMLLASADGYKVWYDLIDYLFDLQGDKALSISIRDEVVK